MLWPLRAPAPGFFCLYVSVSVSFCLCHYRLIACWLSTVCLPVYFLRSICSLSVVCLSTACCLSALFPSLYLSVYISNCATNHEIKRYNTLFYIYPFHIYIFCTPYSISYISRFIKTLHKFVFQNRYTNSFHEIVTQIRLIMLFQFRCTG